MMRINVRRPGAVTVVDLSGKLSLPESPGRLKDKITHLASQGHKNIVLNLAEVSYVDSSGLGELVACYLTATRFGGTVKLANVSARTRELLVLTRLVTIFEAYSSEAGAIRSFAAATLQPA